MFERIFRRIFRKSCEERQFRDQAILKDAFVDAVGFYTQEVQSENHAREARVAMLWAVASLIYLR